MRGGNRAKGVFINVRRVALANRAEVRPKAQPLEVLHERMLVLETTSQPVVILDAEQHAAAETLRDAPDIHGMHHVADVQVPCRRRSEARERVRRKPAAERLEIHVHDGSC